MRGTLLRIAAAALSAAALFAGGHVCAHLVHPPGDPATLHVTLTLYDQDGRPLCQSARSVRPYMQNDSWQGHSTLPDGEEVGYSVTVRQEG